MLTDIDIKNSEKTPRYSCDFCDFKSSNRNDYKRHLATDKHWRLTDIDIKNSKKLQTFLCSCGRVYKYRQSLSAHKKKCQKISEPAVSETSMVTSSQTEEGSVKKPEEEINYKELLMILVNENKEMRKTISEIIPRIGNTINANNNTVHNNQKINISVFLNEKCKDAISIDDFVKRIEISVSDLLFTKDKGLIAGVSNIFIENMNKLPLCERPIHCTDIKREVLYIKKEEDWTKDSNKAIIKQALNEVASKQARSVVKWKAENPDFMEFDEKKDDFVRIVKATTDDINEAKVIKTICKDIHLSQSAISECD